MRPVHCACARAVLCAQAPDEAAACAALALLGESYKALKVDGYALSKVEKVRQRKAGIYLDGIQYGGDSPARAALRRAGGPQRVRDGRTSGALTPGGACAAEISMEGFAQVLALAKPRQGEHFIDVGSGTPVLLPLPVPSQMTASKL